MLRVGIALVLNVGLRLLWFWVIDCYTDLLIWLVVVFVCFRGFVAWVLVRLLEVGLVLV